LLSIQQELIPIVGRYGYGVVGLVIMLESMGLPLPAETLLVAAALYAASTHHLDITSIVLAAMAGAIVGDNLGYLIGARFGTPLLVRHGKRIGLTARRLRIGQYLFRHYGREVVFFGRFTAVLRTFAALLAGANAMPWRSFLLWNALGGMVWSCTYGFGVYGFGDVVVRLRGPVELVLGGFAVVGVVIGIVFLRRYEGRLEALVDREANKDGPKA
jgi:membrane protein DedA with SNARE-associated domain